MPHQCVHCGKLYKDAAPELLKGCSCGSHFFFYIKKEKYKKMKERGETDIVKEWNKEEKKKIEKDVRDIVGIKEEEPVILDLESIRVMGPGKFEIDVVNLFDKERPLIYKLEEGKYIIDLSSSFKKTEELRKKIKKPKRKSRKKSKKKKSKKKGKKKKSSKKKSKKKTKKKKSKKNKKKK